jgi:aminopeptidase N
MKIAPVACLFFLALLQLKAQDNFSYPANTYRTAGNKYYWKNRKPYEGYWQQDIYYKINAALDDNANTISGTEELTYYNNSPDTLSFVFFHLYSNAFQPNSYMDKLYKANKVKTYYGRYERQGKGLEVHTMECEGKQLKMEVDNTIMKVYLPHPLLPNQSIQFNISFTNYFDNGSVRRRMKMFVHNGFKQYDGVHWYPRIALYDRKGGWNTDQHLGREFNGDFGAFDVAITLPKPYVLEATGNLLNENEVLPKDLREKLDIKNFAQKPFGEKPSVIIQPDGTNKTWRFHAENVHDFAWTADPTYRIGEADWNGIRCIAIAQEESAGRWQTAAEFTAKVIETNSRDFGMYGYPKIVVADARDGMEYPMLTLCSGRSPDYDYVISHEVSHEWFFGQIGNNETYRAMLDEGFTQFLTAWDDDKIDGPYGAHSSNPSKYIRKHSKPATTRDAIVYNPYFRTATYPDALPLSTHSDYFYSALGQGGGYGTVYYKTATMLYDLQYILGDSLFLAAMEHYFNQWKFCHPYVEDFRNSIIQFTHVNLNWFFDAWIETPKYIDYKIKKVRKDSTGSYAIIFKRKGGIQMPLDVTVITKDGKQQNILIPCTYFSKSTSATVEKPWIGWDKLNDTYTAHVQTDSKIKDVIIDTSNRLADVDLRNNRLHHKSRINFDYGIYNPASRYYYQWLWRPDIWYNSIDGIKAGAHLEGSYVGKDLFHLTAWYNTTLGQQTYQNTDKKRDAISFITGYTSHDLSTTYRDWNWFVDGRMLDGLDEGRLGFNISMKHNFILSTYYKAMIRQRADDLDYLLYPTEWNYGKWNNTLNMSISRSYTNFKSYGSYDLKLRTSGPGSNYQYSTISGEIKHHFVLAKLLVHNRAMISYSSGTNIAPESKLFLAGANPEEMMDDKFTRAIGFLPTEWLGYGNVTNHFQQAGGMNVRGYAGYVAADLNKNKTVYTYSGTAGAAANIEVDFSRYLSIRPRKYTRNFSMNTYLFADGGVINMNAINDGLQLSYPRIDAGFGALLTIKQWGPFQKAQPLTIRCDLPLFLNSVPYDEGQQFKFRYVVGINQLF